MSPGSDFRLFGLLDDTRSRHLREKSMINQHYGLWRRLQEDFETPALAI